MSKLPVIENLVLYADDDSDDIEFVRESFNKFAKNVAFISFSNGLELVKYLKSHGKAQHPCLIMVDINMPVMNGKETLVKIREMKHFDNVPVILFSTSSLPSDKNYAAKHNAGFVTKPLNYQQMDIIVDQLLENCTDEVQHRLNKQL